MLLRWYRPLIFSLSAFGECVAAALHCCSLDIVTVVAEYCAIECEPEWLHYGKLPPLTVRVLVSPSGDVWLFQLPTLALKIVSPDHRQLVVSSELSYAVYEAAISNRCTFDADTGELLCNLLDEKEEKIVVVDARCQQAGSFQPKWTGRLVAMHSDNRGLYLLTNDAGGHGGSLYRVQNRDASTMTQLKTWRRIGESLNLPSRLLASTREIFVLVLCCKAFLSPLSQLQVFDKATNNMTRCVNLEHSVVDRYRPSLLDQSLSLIGRRCHPIADLLSDRDGNLTMLFDDNSASMHSSFTGERIASLSPPHMSDDTFHHFTLFIDKDNVIYYVHFPRVEYALMDANDRPGALAAIRFRVGSMRVCERVAQIWIKCLGKYELWPESRNLAAKLRARYIDLDEVARCRCGQDT